MSQWVLYKHIVAAHRTREHSMIIMNAYKQVFDIETCIIIIIKVTRIYIYIFFSILIIDRFFLILN